MERVGAGVAEDKRVPGLCRVFVSMSRVASSPARCGRLAVALWVVVGEAEERNGDEGNYSAEQRGQGGGIRGSSERVSRGDTGNNCSSPGNGVGDALSSSEMTLFA